MIGHLAGLLCAFLWSLSSVMLRSEEEKIDVLSLNALRLFPAAAMFVGMLVVTGRFMEITQVHWSVFLILTTSVLVGLAVGDTAYFRSMYLIGVDRALPITNAYPLFTLVFAFFVLGEQPTLMIDAGILLIMLGVSVIAIESAQEECTDLVCNRTTTALGVILAVVAAIAWATSTTLLKVGTANLDIVAANSIRLPIASVVMATLATSRGHFKVSTYGRRSLSNVAVAGVLGAGLGGLAFLAAIQLSGAAEAAALSSAAPLFGVPLEFFLLKEKITRKIVIGTILSVIGIWLLF